MKTQTATKIAMAISVLGTAGGCGRFIRTPQRAIHSIAEALREQDLAAVEKHVDIESVTNGLVDQALVACGDNLDGLFLRALRPRILDSTRRDAVALIESGQTSQERTEAEAAVPLLSLLREWRKRALGQLSIAACRVVRKEGRMCLVEVDIQHERYGKPSTLTVRMRDRGDCWQVAEVRDAYEYLETLDEFERDFTAARNSPIREAMAATLTFGRVRKGTTRGFCSRNATLEFDARNTGPEAIDSYTVRIRASDSDSGREIIELTGTETVSIPPGGEERFDKSVSVPLFFGGDAERLFNHPASTLSFALDCESLAFANGESLRLYRMREP